MSSRIEKTMDVILKKILWAVVALYGVTVAWLMFEPVRPRNVDVSALPVVESPDFSILFIEWDRFRYGDTEMTDEEFIDMVKAGEVDFSFYLAEPDVDDDRIANVLQFMKDHGKYLQNITDVHKQTFIMKNRR
jgi:hypothetical protein